MLWYTRNKPAGFHYRILDGLLAILLWSGSSTAIFAQSADTDSNGVPIYRFHGGYLNNWLILGPVPTGSKFAEPVESLGEIRAGQEVTFSDGQKRTWTPVTADGRGVVPLRKIVVDALAAGEFVRDDIHLLMNYCVIYAYCQLEETSGQPRQILMGMDDGARVWVGEEQVISDTAPDFLSLYEHAFPVDFENTQRRGLLLELHNHTGGCEFACYGGRSLQGKAVYLDGVTPVREVPVTILVPGQATQTVRTDNSGRFQIAAIPYGVTPTIHCLATTLQPSLKSQGEGLELEPIEIIVSRGLAGGISQSKLPTPPGRFVAVTECPDGLILLANDTDKTIYCYNGLRTYKHPNSKLHRFTQAPISDICMGPNGELWIATAGDGLFRLIGDALFHWPVEQTGSFLGAMHAASNGDLLVGFEERFAPEAAQVFCIPVWTDELLPLDAPHHGKAARAFLEEPATIDASQPEATQTWIAYHGSNIVPLDEASHPVIVPPVEARIKSMIRARDGKLWFAGRSLFSLDEAGIWTEIPWLSNTPEYERCFVGEASDGTIWAVAGSSVYVVTDGNLLEIPISRETGSAQRLCLSSCGVLYVTAGSAGVIELRQNQLRKFGYRDGVFSSRGLRVSATPQGVILCSDDNQPVLAANDQLQIMDVSGLTQGNTQRSSSQVFDKQLFLVGLSDQSLLAFPVLQQQIYNPLDGASLHPRIKRPGGTWQELNFSAWSEPVYRFTFCTELSDQRVLIGTQMGIVEVEGNQLVPSHVLDDYPGHAPAALAAFQAADQSLWIALCEGQLVNVKDGKSTIFDLPLKSVFGATALAEFNGKIWIGNADGLFYVDPQAGQVCGVDDPSLTAQAVVGLETGIADGQMWIATRPGRVLAMRQDETTTTVPIFDAGKAPTINDSVTGPDGKLWLATDDGNFAYQPSVIAPVLLLDKVQGLAEDDWVDGQPMRAECNRTVTIGIAWRDDTPATPTLRFRVNHGPWRINSPESEPDFVQLEFDSPGTQIVDLQCYGGESNYSNILTLEFEAFYPLWRDPRMQAAAVFSAVLALAVIGYLTWLNYRTRHERNQIRENLLAEESRARRTAEETSKEREMLLGRVCHDLRNPLGVVGMVSDLLKTADIDRDTMVELLDGSAQSMSYLTEQLLTYVQSRSGGIQPVTTPVVLSKFMHNFEAAGKLRLQKSEVELITRIDSSAPAVVVFDPNMLTEILNNLFENAVRHTTTGSIALECHQTPDSRLQFILKDSGSGMCQDTLASIFRPFYRGESRPITDSSGVGLGMFVVHELVNCMQAQIGISSQLGVGTTVRITLPLEPELNEDPHLSDSEFNSQPAA